MNRTAIVLSGAGARGAYEAGILDILVPRLRNDSDEIVVIGTSAGAINAVLLAASDAGADTRAMLAFWLSRSIGDVIRNIRETGPLDVGRYVAQILHTPFRLRSLLDSRPLGHTLEKIVDWRALDRNLAGDGWIKALGVATTCFNTGRTVIFVQGAPSNAGSTLPPPDESRGIDYARVNLRTSHVLASSAMPVVFLPVHVTAPKAAEGWYLDGGVRLNTPIKPALSLGADRVVVIGTTPDPQAVLPPQCLSRPDVFDAAGAVLHSVLVDQLSEDISSLRRVNVLLGKPGRRSRYRYIPNLYVGPPASGIISATANLVYAEEYGGLRSVLTQLGLLGTMLGGSTESHGELLSFLFFDATYHAALIDLGRSHALKQLADRDLPWQ